MQKTASAMGLLCFAIGLMTAFAPNARAQNSAPPRYYTFDEVQNSSPDSSWRSPQDFLRHGLNLLMDADTLSLISWLEHDETAPFPTEPYNRTQQFGTWMKDPTKQTCYDTRARVLIRDSQAQVEFGNNKCTVAGGLWKDPYTGSLFQEARQIQIDHVVPLKNAYITGAFAWTPKHRCTYANFVADDYHLLSVSGHENMSKGDSSPAGYLPPDGSYVCTYIKNWLSVKMAWQLYMVDDEIQAITQALKDHGCADADMTIGKTDLQNVRAAMLDESACENFGAKFKTH